MIKFSSIRNRFQTSSWAFRAARAGLLLGALLFAVSSQAGTVLRVPAKAGGEGIQKALDGLTPGGEVDLEAGTYTIRHPVILRKDHEILRGAGPSTILYLADKANCPVVVLGDPIAHPAGPTRDLTLSSLQINGNRKHQQRELWLALPDGEVINNGVDVWDVDGAKVEHVICGHCRSGGMVASAVTRRLNVNDFTAFDNQFDGLACYMTENSHFTKLYLHDNLAAGISLDLNFNHNLIDDAILSANDLGVFMRQSRSNVFRGMTIQKSRHQGVFMAQTADWTPKGWTLAPGTECTGNSFENIMVGDCGGTAFVVNDATCKGNFINTAHFFDNAGGLLQGPTNPVTVRDLVQDSSRHEEALVVKPQQSAHAGTDHISSKTL